jgi:hypothetical protein
MVCMVGFRMAMGGVGVFMIMLRCWAQAFGVLNDAIGAP